VEHATPSRRPADAPAEVESLASVDPRWVTAVVRVRVRGRLSAWPGRKIGAFDEDDLVNHVLIALLENDRAAFQKFDPARSSAEAYLKDFANKRLIELERKELRRRAIDDAERAAARNERETLKTFDTPEKWFEYFEKRDELIAFLRASGAPEDLDLFYLAFVRGMSNAEVASLRGVPAEHVANRKFAIRKRVGAYLERAGGGEGSKR
jgi:RNA polymerase sigma factor (sigma-70 family)